MNQDFTDQKKQYLSEKKISCRGVHLNSCTSSERKKTKKNSCQLKIPHPPSPPPRITFLMVRPLNTKIRLTMLFSSGFELYSRWVPLLQVFTRVTEELH